MTEEQKAERRTLIANNKAWAAAEVVRREWLTKFLNCKSMPKDAPAVLAALLGGSNAHRITQGVTNGRSLAKELLGLEHRHGNQIAEHAAEHPTKPCTRALTVALGTIEDTTDRQNWRHPEEQVAQRLNILAARGYPLSPVEKIAAMIPNTEAEAEDTAEKE